MKIECENCQRLVLVPAHANEVQCTCGAIYRVDVGLMEYVRTVPGRNGEMIEIPVQSIHRMIPDDPVTSFYPPGEPTRETCTAELLAALQKKREADREIEFWERKLREAE